MLFKSLFDIKLVLVVLLFLAPGICRAEDDDDSGDDALRILARQGNVKAQLKLADEYFYGKNRPQNYNIAVRWYRKAAEQNNPIAEFNLAICYERGIGIRKSRYHAFRYYKMAAESGIKEAKFNLALCYAIGIPPDSSTDDRTPAVFADFAKAEALLKELGDAGFMPAIRELASL